MTAKTPPPKRRSDVSVRIVEGEALVLVLAPQGDRLHHLNPTATYIWNRCDGTFSEAALVQQLTQAFDVHPEIAAQDVAMILLQLQQLELLEPRASDSLFRSESGCCSTHSGSLSQTPERGACDV